MKNTETTIALSTVSQTYDTVQHIKLLSIKKIIIFFSQKLGNSGLVSMMCSNCGGTNSNKDANNLVLIQDVISIKSYLQKLRRILHDVSTIFFTKLPLDTLFESPL